MFGDRHKDYHRDSRAGPSRPSRFHHDKHDKHQKHEASKQVDRIPNSNFKNYTCPECNSSYDCLFRGFGIVGRIPTVLPCQHTVCFDCLQKVLKYQPNYTCPQCQTVAILPANREIFEEFNPNFFLLGRLLWSRHSSTNNKQSTGNTQFRLIPHTEMETEVVDNFEKCSYVACDKKALLRCPECNDIYCGACCKNLHQSARAMWNHKPEQIVVKDRMSFELEMCTNEDHNLPHDLFCKDCNVSGCCYCFLDQHNNHQRVTLTKLDELEEMEMESLKERAEKVLNHLTTTQRKVKRLSSAKFTTNVEKDIVNYFLNFYNKLQTIEENLLKDVQALKNKSVGLERINAIVKTSIKDLQKLLSCSEKIATKKYNSKMVLERLREIDEIPCHLLTKNDGLDKIKFEDGFDINELDLKLKIKFEKNKEFVLVKSSELPDGYQEMSRESETDDTASEASFQSPVHWKHNSNVLKPKRRKLSQPQHKPSNYEQITVTHIKSIDCIYVQLHRDLNKIRRIDAMAKEVAEISATPKYIDPNHLYLAQYKVKDSKKWYRVRALNVKEGKYEYWECFFIDYGFTHSIEKSHLKMTSPEMKIAPFVKECQLFNPTGNCWTNDAHQHLQRIIQNKELFMNVRESRYNCLIVNLYTYSKENGFTSVADLLFNTCRNVVSSADSSSTTTSRDIFIDVKIFENSFISEPKQTEQVVIASVVSPCKIFVHIERNVDALTKLIGEMKRHFHSTTPNQFIPTVGMYLLVEHRDKIRGNYHRAKVRNVQQAIETVNVDLIDWGYTVQVPWNKTRILGESFTRLEVQAIQVKLADIKPPNNEVEFARDATEYLMKYFLIRDTLKMVVYKTTPQLEVALFQPSIDHDVCINARLVALKFAESDGELSRTVEWFHTEEKMDDSKENDNSIISSMLKNIDITEDVIDENHLSTKIKQPVNIIKIESPGCIYIKFEAQSELEKKLSHEMQVNYTAEQIIKEDGEEWEVNEKCAVYYDAEMSYVRGIILKKLDSDTYLIDLYDKATEITKNSKNIFKLSPYFGDDFPLMVYKSHLAYLKPAGDSGQWSAMSIEALTEFLQRYKKVFVTRVNEKANKVKSFPMEMWCQQMLDGDALQPAKIKYVSVNSLLVKLGVAYRTSEFLLDVKEEEDSDCEVIEFNDGGNMFKNLPTIKIKDWEPALPLTERKFDAFILFLDHDGFLFLRSTFLQSAYEAFEQKFIRGCLETRLTNLPDNECWEANKLCTIKDNGKFYRGRVNKTIDNEMVNVTMVDFGSEHTVHRNNLFKEILYHEISILANKVCLADVYAKNNGKWLSSDYDTCLEMAKEFAHVEIKGDLDVEVPMVEIYDDEGSLNDRIVEKCSNLTRNKNWREEIKKDSDDDAIIIEEDDVEMKFDELNMKYILNIPENVKIQTIIDYRTLSIGCANEDSEQMEELTDLFADINKTELVKLKKDVIKVGLPCVALYKDDGLLYRAEIFNTDSLDCDLVMVFYVDFGNIDCISINQLYEMRVEWFRLPVFYFVVSLNILLKDQKYEKYVLKHIEKLESCEKVAIVLKRDPLIVDLFNVNTKDLTYQTLFDRGFVKSFI